MATRRAAFNAYYSTAEGKKKLGGKTLDQAYAAMRREAGRKGLKADAAGGTSKDAINRRLARARGLSQQNKPKAPWKPMTVGEGFSEVANRLNNGRSYKEDFKSAWKAGNKAGEKINSAIKFETPKAKREKAARAAIERRRKSGLQA